VITYFPQTRTGCNLKSLPRNNISPESHSFEFPRSTLFMNQRYDAKHFVLKAFNGKKRREHAGFFFLQTRLRLERLETSKTKTRSRCRNHNVYFYLSSWKIKMSHGSVAARQLLWVMTRPRSTAPTITCIRSSVNSLTCFWHQPRDIFCILYELSDLFDDNNFG